jgi:Flp pilus assembly protein TadB
VTITAEQERQFIADLERRGETQVRSDLEHGRIAEPFHDIVHRWLSERERSREATQSLQTEAAIRASAAAERAASASERSSVASERSAAAAERQAREAERANKRATIAIIIAIASLIISTVIATLPYWLAHK